MTELEVMGPELLEATDEVIEDAVTHADPLVLRGLLYQLTGDESLCDLETMVGELSPGVELAALANPADVEAVQRKAAEFLKAHRDGGGGSVDLGPLERLPHSLSLVAGEEVPEAELEMWLEELGLDPWARGLKWQQPPPPERLTQFSVVVIGAGMGGLNAAAMLKQAGIPFTVLEKNPTVGGTWYENSYPGARVDSPSRVYMHIFGADYCFSSRFCARDENQRYFEWVADTFGLRDHIVFDTEVTSCAWDEETATWKIEAHGPDGPRELRANAVISAVGFLSRPNLPSIEGMETFQGRSFHTARWPEDLELAGKRVAVIGTGCTGYQLVPELALQAHQVIVFQRTPQWIFPTDGYRTPHAPQVNWLDRNLPYHTNFMRFRVNWMMGPARAARVHNAEPGWEDPHTRSAINKRMRDSCIEFLHAKLGERRPDLLEKMIPAHPPWSARGVLVDREYSVLDALLLDNVELVTDGVGRVTPAGIEAADGRHYDVDVVVYATGFKANDYLWPMEVRGRGGRRVEELWAKDGPRAYLGAMLPGFPNLFLLYGPNTNPFGGFGIVNREEMTTRFALECMERLILHDERAVEVTTEAYWRYNERLDEAEKVKHYSDQRSSSYYRGQFTRSATNCPFPVNQMWAWLRRPNFDELIVR